MAKQPIVVKKQLTAAEEGARAASEAAAAGVSLTPINTPRYNSPSIVKPEETTTLGVNDKYLGTKPTVDREGAFSALDKARLGAAIVDIVGVGASVVPGFHLASTITGVGSSLANIGIDIADPNVSGWDAAKNAGLNLGLDALSLIPLGKAGKAARGLKSILPYIPKAIALYGGIGNGKEAGSAAAKAARGEWSKITAQEYQAVVNIMQLAAGFKKRSVVYKNEGRAKFPTNVNTTKVGNVEIPTKNLEYLPQRALGMVKNAKTNVSNHVTNAKIDYANAMVADKLPVKFPKLFQKMFPNWNAYTHPDAGKSSPYTPRQPQLEQFNPSTPVRYTTPTPAHIEAFAKANGISHKEAFDRLSQKVYGYAKGGAVKKFKVGDPVGDPYAAENSAAGRPAYIPMDRYRENKPVQLSLAPRVNNVAKPGLLSFTEPGTSNRYSTIGNTWSYKQGNRKAQMVTKPSAITAIKKLRDNIFKPEVTIDPNIKLDAPIPPTMGRPRPTLDQLVDNGPTPTTSSGYTEGNSSGSTTPTTGKNKVNLNGVVDFLPLLLRNKAKNQAMQYQPGVVRPAVLQDTRGIEQNLASEARVASTPQTSDAGVNIIQRKAINSGLAKQIQEVGYNKEQNYQAQLDQQAAGQNANIQQQNAVNAQNTQAQNQIANANAQVENAAKSSVLTNVLARDNARHNERVLYNTDLKKLQLQEDNRTYQTTLDGLKRKLDIADRNLEIATEGGDANKIAIAQAAADKAEREAIAHKNSFNAVNLYNKYNQKAGGTIGYKTGGQMAFSERLALENTKNAAQADIQLKRTALAFTHLAMQATAQSLNTATKIILQATDRRLSQIRRR